MRSLTDTDLIRLQDHIDKNGTADGFVPAPKRRRKNEESEMQRALMKWWAYACKGFKVHPWLLFSIPNGGARSQLAGAFMKMEGQRRGVPDLMGAISRGPYCGLFIEMKTPKGNIKPEQAEYHALLRDQGYAVHVCRSFDEAVKVITEYLSR